MSGSERKTRVRAVTVVGIGADGCASLSTRSMNAVAKAHVLVGGERHHAFFPQFAGERIFLDKGVGKALDVAAERAFESTVCVLASGDPLFFGIGNLVLKKFGAEHVEILPHPSSVQWAYARSGEPWHDARFISVHGRSREGLAMRLRRTRKAALLTDAENTPPRIAAHLIEYSDDAWEAWVGEELGGPGERVRSFTLAELAACTDIGPLNVLLLRRPEGWRMPPAIPFLPEAAFEKRMPKKGLITKREARTLSLASMDLRPDSVVWDVGAGSGAVAIEAAMLAFRGKVFAIEVDPEGAAICSANARAHGADNVVVVEGRAPDALAALNAPNAVFVGGSKGSMEEIIGAALDRALPGARIVVNAITLENVGEAYRVFRARGISPDVTMLNVSRAEPLAHYMRFAALNPIHIFAATKPEASATESSTASGDAS